MTARYRFLPWTRSGLASQVAAVDAPGADLATRAEFPVRVRLTTGDAPSVSLTLYGPGDVIGIDPRVIVRTEPRRLATDVEPNFTAAIEFDPPDFPWMFTPASAGSQNRLRPWLVLVVVAVQDGVALAVERDRPLPTLTIEAPATPDDELPDISESWAWAHTQVITDDDTEVALDRTLEERPELNVSRVICPRRLEPGRRYLACLVPSFEVGRLAGLGAPVPDDAPTGPAWRSGAAAPGRVELPVYFHWEFATGPDGDFEALARRLVPRPAPDTLGSKPMYLGRAGPGMPDLPPDQEGAIVGMEGALRAADSGDPPGLDDLPDEVKDRIRGLVDAPRRHLAEGTPGDAEPVAPPLYGRWHQQLHGVPDGPPPWFREVNLDPRYRTAAGLGVLVVRANQEELMNAAWEQVGDVLAANALLNRARFSLEAARRLHRRHVAGLAAEQLLKLTAPLHVRVPVGDVTVRSLVHGSLVPDAALDPSFRRWTGGQNPVLKRSARRAGLDLPPERSVAVHVIEPVNRGELEASPTTALPDGVEDLAALSLVSRPGAGTVDLSPVGLPVAIDATIVERVAGQLDGFEPAVPVAVEVRPDLATTGIVTADHLDAVIASAPPGTGVLITTEIIGLPTLVGRTPGSVGFVLPSTEEGIEVRPLDVLPTGEITVRRPATEPDVVVGRVDRRVAASGPERVAGLLAGLPPGSLDPTGSSPPTRIPAGGLPPAAPAPRAPSVPPGVPLPRPPTVPPPTVPPPTVPPPTVPPPTVPPPTVPPPTVPPPTVPPPTMPPLETRPAAVIGLSEALSADVEAIKETDAIATPEPVPALDVTGAGAAVLQRTDPSLVVPARIGALVRFGDLTIGELDPDGDVHLATDLGPVMAYPRFDRPLYEHLAAYDRDAFLPGIGGIPANTITLLETNPQFVEAFLVGANVEMAAELLWREFPTDRRGSPFRHFWDRVDGEPDIPELHRWSRRVRLGGNSLGNRGGGLVLLLRGDLLRRYPTAAVYAVRAGPDGRLGTTESDHAEPVMYGRIDPDITFAGFDLTPDQVRGDPGWFFVIAEQPTEPRFGLDLPGAEDPTVPASTRDATWGHAGVPPGGHLRLGDPGALAGLLGSTPTSANLASVLLQQPVRVAVLARDALPDEES